MSLELGLIIFLIFFAFFCEYLDSTLGMGYGTIMSPVLLILGFNPVTVVFAILISELITGILAGIIHHSQGNVNFKINIQDISVKFKERFSLDLKIVMVLISTSILGALSAGILAGYLPQDWIRLYIGIMVVMMGIIILFCINRDFRFSWIKIIGLGLLASFNKGISGGGYGPLVASGQIICGVKSKRAIGITSLAEGLTCFVGALTYIITLKKYLDIELVLYIVSGAVCAVPFSGIAVRRISDKKLKVIIGIFTIILGISAILKTIFK